MVEVRDRMSQRVREQIELIEGQDYEIDPFQGRVMLSRPLQSTANMSVLSIIRQAPLDGDEVVLIADYEYITTGFSGGEGRNGWGPRQNLVGRSYRRWRHLCF